MSSSSAFWDAFAVDPRDDAHAVLRASDADRDVISQALTEAFADGRLDREEYDDRATTLAASRTLGELPPLVADLVSSRGLATSGSRAAVVPTADLRSRAVAAYECDRRDALLGMLGPGLICTVIWAVTSGDWHFFWPAFVIAATLVNLIRVVVRRTDIVEDHLRSLERREAKERRKRELSDPTRPAE